MLETLDRETATLTPLFEALQRGAHGHAPVLPLQSRVVVHRPGAPRPALRTAPLTAHPLTLPPSERAVRRAPATRLRLTRRGRLTLLVAAITLLFIAFSIGQVMTNAATSAPAPAVTHTVVVAPGDTAWSIARAAMPKLDGREAVDKLLAMNHSDGTIQVGETLIVPGR